MCFTPLVSISTAIIEFIIAAYLILHFKKSKIAKPIAIFCVLLGIYQLTEFLLCTTSYQFWAKIGFITTAFLPALALHFTINYTKNKERINKRLGLLIYLIPTFYFLMALAKENFILNTSCGNYFVTMRYIIQTGIYKPLGFIYLFYYISFVAIACVLFLNHYKKQKNILKKEIDVDVIIAVIISLIPAVVLLFLFPMIAFAFPSIYCQFAIAFAIAGLIACHLEKKLKN
ncbi:hypothetical protein KY334_07665 [Candidatus Woesearchaeota archaeon]|nr:hypothetical protein [Candidatus Woesearchaeota archaeon]